MGLDMYLNGKRYLSEYDEGDAEALTVVNKVDIPGKVGKIKYITTEAGYWRKANAIHDWFVRNCQDGVDECQETHIPKEKFEQLLKVVDEVLSDHSKASDLLPVASGFFFGSSNYDDWYFQDLKYTKKVCKAALKSLNMGKYPKWDYYYQSSW